MECFACIHCHFYQPPRENPWLETVESQDSARPYHDWNERIARECYLPNSASRILNSSSRIAKIVNNYAQISFNFGPTLLSWIEQREPEAYERILEGDRESREHFSGHGGALAQAYNHTILPLANSRDKRTQILWGIRDFEQRFKREPEGMWLPETAVDVETLEILSAEGINFTILAPRQAAQLRIGKESPWIDLEYGVDSRRAYVCSLPTGRTIAIFFYDGTLATAVAFEKLLYNGENLARRLLSRYDPEGDSAQLMHVATDGETYGHHHAHGDMALAYALQYLRENKLARITNYGEYLALHPPTQEIRIKENTAWSCAHGVDRWQSNCGCNSGGHGHWSQQWRRPLRDAFDWLRDDLISDFEQQARVLLKDPWLARNDYIEAMLDRSTENVGGFLARHRTHQLSHEEEVRALRLLEMQRHLMLMYTSCGWFFDEPTGPETIQVLQYAARAVQLSQQLFGGDREEEFLSRLEKVCSNLPEFGNGRKIYERFIRPAMLDLPGVAAHYAISSFFDGYQRSDSIYAYEARLRKVNIVEHGNSRLAAGNVQITSHITKAQLDFDFAVLYTGGHNLRCGVREAHDNLAQFIKEAAGQLAQSRNCIDALENYFYEAAYSLKSLFRDKRVRIVSQIVNSTLADIDKLYGEVYDRNSALIGFLRELSMPLPTILRVSTEFVLNNAISRSLSSQHLDVEEVRLLVGSARQNGISLDHSVKSALCERLEKSSRLWTQEPTDVSLLAELENLAALLRHAPFEADLWRIQNRYYKAMMKVLDCKPRLSESWHELFCKLGELLGIAVPERLSQMELEEPVILSAGELPLTEFGVAAAAE